MEHSCSSSNASDGATNIRSRCRCGQVAPLHTSWTIQNPGRKFLGCANYMNANACSYFKWVELETCRKGKEIGEYFHSQIEEMQAKMNQLRQQNERLERAYENVNAARVSTKLQNVQLLGKCEEMAAIIESLHETVSEYKEAMKEKKRTKSKGRKLMLFILVVLAIIVIAVVKETNTVGNQKKKKNVYFLP